MQQHAGIDGAAAGPHQQAVQRGEAHGGGDAAPAGHRAQAGAVAQVRDDRPTGRRGRRARSQRRVHVLVRQAVEPVAPDPFVPVAARQPERLRDVRLAAMKAVSKQATCGTPGNCSRDGPDGGQVVRLVQRRQRDQRVQLAQHRRVDGDGSRKAHAAVHDPVSDGGDRQRRQRAVADPGQQVLDGAGVAQSCRPATPAARRRRCRPRRRSAGGSTALPAAPTGDAAAGRRPRTSPT